MAQGEPRGLLWIHKTAASPALSNNRDNRIQLTTVNKHVQRGSKITSRSRKLSPLKSISHFSSSVNAARQPAERKNNKLALFADSENTASTPPLPEASAQHVLANHQTGRQVNPQSYYGKLLDFAVSHGLRVDPFNSFPGRMTDCVPAAIDYWLRVWAPSQMAPSNTHRVNPLITHIFPLVLQHKECFESVVAVSVAFSGIGQSPNGEPSRQILHHQGNAIAAMSSKIIKGNGQIDDSLVATAVCLMALDMTFHDLPSFKSHHKGLRYMASRREDADHSAAYKVLSGYVLLNDLHADIIEYIEISNAYKKGRANSSASKSASASIEEYPDPSLELYYPRHPFSPRLCEKICMLPTGLQDLALTRTLSVAAIDLMCEISNWTVSWAPTSERNTQAFSSDADIKTSAFMPMSRADHATKSASPQLAVDIASETWSTIRHGMSFLQSIVKTGTGSKTLETCFCLAFVSVGHSAFPSFRLNKLGTRLLEDLLNGLQNYRESNTRLLKAESECLIWLTVIAGNMAKMAQNEVVAKKGREGMGWLLENNEVAKDWDELKRVLTRFFWFEHLAKEWEDCWMETREIKTDV